MAKPCACRERFVATGSIIDSSDVRSIALSLPGWLGLLVQRGPMLLSRGQFETTLANLEGDVPDPDGSGERFVG